MTTPWLHLKDLLPHAPERLKSLSDNELSALNNAINAAQARESKALENAIEEAQRHLPALLRIAVRKILFS